MLAFAPPLPSVHDAYAPQRQTGFAVFHRTLHLQTEAGLQFIDVTDEIRALVGQSRVAFGLVNVQTRHTTTAVIVNEHEPLLLEDMKQLLERFAPIVSGTILAWGHESPIYDRLVRDAYRRLPLL
ncbi:MAG: hypothetical protein FJZ47_13635, partial [Candidatus Tectomicrobia bacterium]|nr:hypothetical protein [Candidatus Tectomicrobia bacterium]